MEKSYNFRIMLRKEPEGGYTAYVPSLPGCVTYGETIDEAVYRMPCLKNRMLLTSSRIAEKRSFEVRDVI